MAERVYGKVDSTPGVVTLKRNVPPSQVIFVVGTDDTESGGHGHKSSDSFIRRVDILLKKKTVENIDLKSTDEITVFVPPTMDKSNIDKLKKYGSGIPNYTVLAKKATGLVQFVNSKITVRFLIFFGHGIDDAPIYDYGNELFPKPSRFKKEAFVSDARVYFSTCNSMRYAKKFAQTLKVETIGVEGTTFYGETEISAGRITEDAQPGTSMGWVYKPTDTDAVSESSWSLSQRRGTAFLREQ
ncbi:MAG: hypothetical protein GF398_08355 [Chitinivibrionales bacterium]|nr:hypothetical protein [Chitinivibrionales bacterium]